MYTRDGWENKMKAEEWRDEVREDIREIGGKWLVREGRNSGINGERPYL